MEEKWVKLAKKVKQLSFPNILYQIFKYTLYEKTEHIISNTLYQNPYMETKPFCYIKLV